MNRNTALSASIERRADGVNGRNGFRAPMDILIRTEGVKLNPSLLEAVRCKIGRVRQYAPGAIGARVQLVRSNTNRSSKQYRAHVLYAVKGNDVSAEHWAHDPLAALDLVSEKIERRLRKRKTAALARRVRDYRKGKRDKATRIHT